jgi:choline dehydrogenase-like flavoprotein
MAKAETFHGTEWFEAAEGAHGREGPLHTAPQELAPISELVMNSFEAKGLEYKGDIFSAGKAGVGCGHAVRSVYKGMRSSAADFVADRARYADLEIVFDATVDKLVFDTTTGERPRATGVEVVMKDRTRKQFRARREVVLAGGAYCSPAILMRSGVGPVEELRKLDIPMIHDLPGVGKNLMDHLLVGTAYEVSDPSLTRDSLIYGEGALATSLEAWQTDHSGALSTFPFGAYAYARLDERLSDVPAWESATESTRDAMQLTLNQPNVEIWNTECYGGPPHWTDFPSDGKAVFCLITQLMSPQSRGYVRLKSRDPLDNPVVDHKYLDVELDALVLAEGVKLANEIVMRNSATSDVIKGAWPEKLTHHRKEQREEWVEYVRENAFTGQCFMWDVFLMFLLTYPLRLSPGWHVQDGTGG